MLNIKKLVQPWAETGAMNENLPWFSFIDERTFLTKQGDIGTVIRVDGIDNECLTPDDLAAFTKRFRSALKLLDPSFRLYQILFRHNRPEIPVQSYPNPVVNAAIAWRRKHFEQKADHLYRLDIYYVLLHHPKGFTSGILSALQALGRSQKTGIEQIKALFSTRKQTILIERDLEVAAQRLKDRIRAFCNQLDDFLPVTVLDKAEAFLVLRRLVNPNPVKAAMPGLKYDTHVDYHVASSGLEAFRTHLKLDGYTVRVLTLKEPTSQSWPLVLRKLYEIPANYHAISEWHPLDADVARKQITTARRHHHTQKTSLSAHMADSAPGDILQDDSKTALVQNLAAALTEMEMHGLYFGEFSLSIVIYDRDPDVVEKACSEVYKVFAAHDGAIYQETYNLFNAFFATLPGNIPHNLRRFKISDANIADYSFIFSLSTGQLRNPHLSAEYLALLETQHATPYYMNLHVQDIGHTLMLGKTGSGKSFLLNFLATNAQKYDGYTYFFDLGGSFKGITKLFGGAYLKIGITQTDEALVDRIKINPFSLEPTPENIEFLNSFVLVLLDAEGDATARLSVQDEREVFQTIRTIYDLDPENRTLRNYSNLLPRHIAERMHKWIHGDPDGQYCFLFDNEKDTLEFSKFLCVDFEGLDKYPQLVEPLLFYLLHRANSVIYDPKLTTKLKLFFVDEAWRFFRHPAISRYILEALKTWRKRNAAIILSTQSADDLRGSELLEVLLESCPTKLFLANPSLNAELYSQLFKLTPTTVELVKSLRPKGQLLISRPDHTKVLNLDVDPRAYWLYTNDPNDNARRDAAIERYGFEAGIEHLAIQKGL